MVLHGNGNGLYRQHFCNYLFGRATSQTGLRLEHEAVRNHRFSERFDVVREYVGAASNGGQRLCASIQGEGGTGTCAELHLVVTAGGLDEADHVLANGLINAHL